MGYCKTTVQFGLKVNCKFFIFLYIWKYINNAYTFRLLQSTVHVCLKVTHQNLIFRYIKKCIFFIKYFCTIAKPLGILTTNKDGKILSFDVFGDYKTTVHVVLSNKYQNCIFWNVRLLQNHCASRLERNISKFILSYINKYIHFCRKYILAIEKPLWMKEVYQNCIFWYSQTT